MTEEKVKEHTGERERKIENDLDREEDSDLLVRWGVAGGPCSSRN